MKGKFLKFFAIIVSVLTLFSSFTFADNGKGANTEPSPYDSEYIEEIEKTYDIKQKTDNKSQNKVQNPVQKTTENTDVDQDNPVDNSIIEQTKPVVNDKPKPILKQ